MSIFIQTQVLTEFNQIGYNISAHLYEKEGGDDRLLPLPAQKCLTGKCLQLEESCEHIGNTCTVLEIPTDQYRFQSIEYTEAGI